MPYFVYKIITGPTALVKNLKQIAKHDEYKLAKKAVSELRATQQADDTASFKVIFADNALTAEEQLMQHREASIVREWEK